MFYKSTPLQSTPLQSTPWFSICPSRRLQSLQSIEYFFFLSLLLLFSFIAYSELKPAVNFSYTLFLLISLSRLILYAIYIFFSKLLYFFDVPECTMFLFFSTAAKRNTSSFSEFLEYAELTDFCIISPKHSRDNDKRKCVGNF